jgi:hypothetical protein
MAMKKFLRVTFAALALVGATIAGPLAGATAYADTRPSLDSIQAP